MIDSVRLSLGRSGSWEGFGRLSRVHATKVVFVMCFGGLGPGGCAVAFEPTCKDLNRLLVEMINIPPLRCFQFIN